MEISLEALDWRWTDRGASYGNWFRKRRNYKSHNMNEEAVDADGSIEIGRWCESAEAGPEEYEGQTANARLNFKGSLSP